MVTKREFVINDLMAEDFIEAEANEICLEETEDTGKSVLELHLKSDTNFSIKNVDKKHTEMNFFQKDKSKSMFKRVDHIIFEHISDDKWKLHLIEMKSSVRNEKWTEIKGKFRASYLFAQGIAAMLEMQIEETCMYTTYENVYFALPATMPSARRLPLGEALIKPEEEWDGSKFGLNFGIRIRFMHNPIHMERNADGVLTGEWSLIESGDRQEQRHGLEYIQ